MEEALVRQALAQAWEHVRAKAAAPGPDGIDVADFQTGARHQLQLLAEELLAGAYQPLPARIFTLRKGTKVRELGILCVRDRIAQLALANLIAPRFEAQFSACCYAFRPGKSARTAVGHVCELLEQGRQFFFRADIDDYFNSIHHELLLEKLSETLDISMVDLIHQSICLPELRDGMESRRAKGLCQGSPLSPLLANIFLADYDKKAEQYGCDYLRYCDDLLFLTNDEDALSAILASSQLFMGRLYLSFKAEKTKLGPVTDGFTFLGYAFSDTGSIAQTKAVQSISQRLEIPLEQLLEQFAQNVRSERKAELPWEAVVAVLRGWTQYYDLAQPLLEDEHICTVAAALALESNDQALMTQAQKAGCDPERERFWPLMAEAAAQMGHTAFAVTLYESWFGRQGRALNDAQAQVLYPAWARYYFTEEGGALQALSQAYCDLDDFAFAQEMFLQSSLGIDAENNDDAEAKPFATQLKAPSADRGLKKSIQSIVPDTIDIAQRMIDLFVGENTFYGLEEITQDMEREVCRRLEPLTAETLLPHLRGERSISVAPYDMNGQARCIALDFDVCNKTVAELQNDPGAKLPEVLRIALDVQKQAKRLGMRSLLEFSGYRGYHLWLPMEAPISVSEATTLGLLLTKDVPDAAETGITVERFPKAKSVRAEQMLPVLKLPCGRHPVTGSWCPLLDEQGKPFKDAAWELLGFIPNSPQQVRRLLSDGSTQTLSRTGAPQELLPIEALAPLSQGIESVLKHCIIIRQLCQMARQTGFLAHQDRLHLLFVFSHMGDVGRQYLHQVMRWTFNYRYAVTQGWLERTNEYPISCAKLRERCADKKWIAACRCQFPATGDTYPSPVLHAHAEGVEQTARLPLHQSAKAKPKTSAQAFDTQGQALELAQRMLTLNREKHDIEEQLEDTRQKLTALLYQLDTDHLDVGMGVLRRVQESDGGIGWRLEM